MPAQNLLDWRESQMQGLHELGDSLADTDGPAGEDLKVLARFLHAHVLR